jgi:7-carboxy-7-deazaguanine synthase
MTGDPRALTAPVLEIFASRQGEGIRVGEPQIFVRFGGCNLVCDYCDTPESIPAKSGTVRSLEDVLGAVDRLRAEGPYQTVSLTGGEPLIHGRFLEQLIPSLRQRGLGIYLETNGTLAGALAKVVDGCDWVAMDVKPASAVGVNLWEAHRWFLKKGGKKTFVKFVLTNSTAEADLQNAVDLIADVQPQTPLILQPATEIGAVRSIPLDRLASWAAWAASRVPDVRIIPQIHRLWDIP